MDDAALIKDLGGVAAVAKRFGYSVQRVQNWIARGRIPSAEKLKHPDVLLPELTHNASARLTAPAAE